MSVKQLLKWSEELNIAESLDEDYLRNLRNRVLTGFDEDLRSCQDWFNDVKRIEELASLTAKRKNIPLPNSANIKLPLITKACYEYASTTYPEIVKDGKVVMGRVIGKDPDGSKQDIAERTADFMNWQLIFQSETWEPELDTLLNQLPLVGFLCTKTFYCPISHENKTIICDYKDLIINADVKSLADARRINHVLHVRMNDLIEGVRAGTYLKEPVDQLILRMQQAELDPHIDLIEQHTFLDLDEDQYSEPYVVTALKETGEVLRIVARYDEKGINKNAKDDDKNKDEVKSIVAEQYFTDFHFLKSPKGKFQSVGFGILLLYINETVNSLASQLVDSGSLANMQGGYMDADLKELGSGDSRHNPGEWKRLKSVSGKSIQEGIVPITYKEPSQTLMQLMGLLMTTAKDLSSSTEVTTGNSSPENAKTGATNALIQQGQKGVVAINKRFYRSLTSQFRKLFALNGKYLDPSMYVEVLNDELAVQQQDFDDSIVNIIPVADPNLSSQAVKAQQTQLLIAIQQLPGVDKVKVTQRIVMGAEGIDKPEELMMTEEALNQPNPEIIKLQHDMETEQAKMQIQERQLDLQAQQQQLDALKTQAQILQMKAQATLFIAQADAANANIGFADYQLQLDALSTQMNTVMGYDKMSHEKELQARQQASDAAQQQTELEVPDDTNQPTDGAVGGDAGEQGAA